MFVGYAVFDLCEQHIERHFVFAPFGDYHVGVTLARLNEAVVHGLDGGEILLYDRVNAPASLFNVAAQSAQDPHVGVGIDKYFYIKEVSQLLLVEDQDSLDYYDLVRLCAVCHAVHTVVLRIIIGRAVDFSAVFEYSQMLRQQRGLKGFGVVVIQQLSLLKRHVVVSFIIVIVIDNAHFIRESLGYPLRDCRLSAAAAPGYSDYYRILHLTSSVSFI